MNTTDMLCLPRDQFEHELECMYERKADKLDKRYLRGGMTAEEYDAACKELTAWLDRMNDTYDL